MNGRHLGDLDEGNQMQHVTVLGNQVAVMESFMYLLPLSIGLVAVSHSIKHSSGEPAVARQCLPWISIYGNPVLLPRCNSIIRASFRYFYTVHRCRDMVGDSDLIKDEQHAG